MFATPANPSVGVDSHSPWATAPASGRETILVVEDQDPIAALLTCVLERGGFQVLRARDAADAREIFRLHANQVVVALLDCALPDVNGHVLCAQLREDGPRLPVLFVSGRDLSPVRHALAAGGPTAFVAKPFLPGDILREVRALIGASI
jgi:two-component system cell cycle sensor histidine kinase/response regulator CckA